MLILSQSSRAYFLLPLATQLFYPAGMSYVVGKATQIFRPHYRCLGLEFITKAQEKTEFRTQAEEIVAGHGPHIGLVNMEGGLEDIRTKVHNPREKV